MANISIIRKFSLGQHSYKSVDFQDIITIDDPLDDQEVELKFAQMLARIHRAWNAYRDYVEEANGIELPAY